MLRKYHEWRDTYQWRPGKRMSIYAILLWRLTGKYSRRHYGNYGVSHEFE